MRYAMIVYETEAGVQGRGDPEYQAAYQAYIKAIYESGVAVGGSGLQDAATSTTIRLAGGERLIQDGPFADTKEQLAGFFLIDVPDLDKALEWALAERCAAARRNDALAVGRCPLLAAARCPHLREAHQMGEPDPHKVEEAIAGFRRFGAVLDARLGDRPHVVGSALTIADLTLACSLMYAKETGAPLGEFANVEAWFARICDLDAWKRTIPS